MTSQKLWDGESWYNHSSHYGSRPAIQAFAGTHDSIANGAPGRRLNNQMQCKMFYYAWAVVEVTVGEKVATRCATNYGFAREVPTLSHSDADDIVHTWTTDLSGLFGCSASVVD